MPDVPGTIPTSYSITTSGTHYDPSYMSLETNGDVDYYQITLVAGMTYDFKVDAVTLGRDANIEWGLYSATNQEIRTTVDDQRLSITPAASGTYYIRIEDSYTGDSASEGSYAIIASMNDDVLGTTATTANITGTGQTTRDLGQADDIDYFRVNLTRGLTYDFALSALNGTSSHMEISLLTSTGTELQERSDGSSISWTPTASGTYYIRVEDNYSGDGEAEGTYTITAGMSDTILNSVETSANITGSGNTNSSLAENGDVDFFRVNLTRGQSYDFSLAAAAGTGAHMEIALLSSTGTVLDRGSDGSAVSLTPTTSGTYYISVTDSYTGDDAGEGAYTVTARMSDTILDSTATTRNITGSGTTASALEASEDVDFFRVNLVAGRNYGFKLTGDGSVNSLDNGRVQILSSTGTVLDYEFKGGTAVLNPSSGGTYYVVVRDNQSDDRAEGNYRLTAMMSDTIVNTTATTATLAPNGSVASRIDAPNDTDWFKISLREGLSYGFTLAGDGSAGRLSDPDLFLRDTDGATVLVYGNNSQYAANTITWTADQSGTYYVQANRRKPISVAIA